MRRSEAVKEVYKRNLCFQRSEMRYSRQIHNLLYGVSADHCKACLACSHNVSMVAEYVQSVCSQRPCGYVEHTGSQFARDLVHIGDHKQKALRRRKRAGECTRRQRTVNRAGSAALRLHL